MNHLLKGANGNLLITDQYVEIQRGRMDRILTGAGGSIRIPYHKISSIEYKTRGLLTRGFIRFHGSGMDHIDDRMKDRYTVCYNRNTKEWDQMAEVINGYVVGVVN